MKIFKKISTLIIITFLSIGLFGCDKGKEALGLGSNIPPQEIDIGDIKSLGYNLVDKKISIEGMIFKAYPCKHTEGYQCLVLGSINVKSKEAEPILVKNGLYDFAFYKSILITDEKLASWVDSKDLDGTLPAVKITGTVKLFRSRDGDGDNLRKSPVIEAEKIEVLKISSLEMVKRYR